MPQSAVERLFEDFSGRFFEIFQKVSIFIYALKRNVETDNRRLKPTNIKPMAKFKIKDGVAIIPKGVGFTMRICPRACAI